MNNRIIFAVAAVGVCAGVFSAYYYGRQKPPQAPLYQPAADPYARGIYANGILESTGASGENVTLYPEVTGPITRLLVSEGQTVTRGTPLLTIDDSVQRATTEQLQAQAAAALALLQELKAQPRPETLEVARAQVGAATASLQTARDQQTKLEASYTADPHSISRDALDNARNATRTADANLAVAQRQFDLTKAGAWHYDIENQQRQYDALSKAAAAAAALLAKYTLTAPIDGVVLAVQAAVGSYVSTQGAYSSYTGGYGPLIVIGAPQDQLQVRAYVDEILIHRLPDSARIDARVQIRGTDLRFPMVFERVQPYVTPKIQLSDDRAERVDVRVLPLIFRFDKPKNLSLFPGQLVDVYIGEK